MKHTCTALCFIIPTSIPHAIIKNTLDDEYRKLIVHNLTESSGIRAKRELLGTNKVYLVEPVQQDNGKILIYNAKNKSALPGNFIKTEGLKKLTDVAADNVNEFTKAVREFYATIYKRNSFDNEGGNLISTIHYQVNYDNAFWDGEQMIYGDGDGKLFNSFTKAIEITGHELTHGVVGATAQLDYSGESGALNESYADIFGSMIKQWHLSQSVHEADWIIGNGLFTNKVNGVGVRKLDAPGTAYDDPIIGKDDTRGTYKTRYKGSEDNGGVHLNSGIPSLAFVTAAKIIGGNTWEKLGLIWYQTLTDELESDSNFKDAAIATLKVANSLFSDEPEVGAAIQVGWKTVGVI